jgi:rhamnulokinase
VQALEKTLKKPVECINMVGGGTQDEFLCQLTADVTGKEVQAGPIEASVTGNILMQLKALNRIKSIAEGRQVVQQSFAMKHYSPRG